MTREGGPSQRPRHEVGAGREAVGQGPGVGKSTPGRGPDVTGGAAAADRARPPRPLHRYGQNHLVDANILAAIVRQADVRAGDVVLEVGAADGRLTRPLLERARLVHAFEVDHRYETRLARLAAAHANLCVHAGDALRVDLTTLDPPPTALVANLAYNIAIPLIMTSIAELPSVARWAVMVQRELAERLFAVPRTKAYSAVSVLVQLACRREEVRAVPASAFRPRPRVESVFITFARRRPPEDARAGPGARAGMDAASPAADAGAQASPAAHRATLATPAAHKAPLAVPAADEEPQLAAGEYAAMDRLVRRAFGQRRKVLSTTLAGATRAGITLSRDDVRRTLDELGLGAAARPEELAPPQWVTLARRLAWLEPAAPARDDGAPERPGAVAS